MSLLKIEVINMKVAAGGALMECAAEAIEVCTQHRADVEFVHNERTFRVSWKDLEACVREIE